MALHFSGQNHRSLGIIIEDYFSYNIKFTFNACGEKRIGEGFRQATFI